MLGNHDQHRIASRVGPEQARVATMLLLTLAACGSQSDSSIAGPQGGAPGRGEDTAAYSGIGPEETIHFTGTEPFWGGEASGGTLTYSTPENIDGTTIAVERFAGAPEPGAIPGFERRPGEIAIGDDRKRLGDSAGSSFKR